MKVIDLKELLEKLDPEMEVHIGYDYGDRSHTTVTPAAREAEECFVKRSDYHQMDALVEIDDDQEQIDEEDIDSGLVRKVVVIR